MASVHLLVLGMLAVSASLAHATTCDNNALSFDQRCCPGTDVSKGQVVSCATEAGNCVGNPPVCKQCAFIDKACCRGRDQINRSCPQQGELYGVQAYCKPPPCGSAPGTRPICTQCGTAGHACCPFARKGDPCGVKYAPAYCKAPAAWPSAFGAGLHCVACGRVNQDCCPPGVSIPACFGTTGIKCQAPPAGSPPGTLGKCVVA